MNKHITEYLNDYVRLTNPQFAVLITGKWGCGKTYYIKNLLKQWESEFNYEDDKSIVLKPIYVSLNGLSSIKSINERISAEINPFLHSKVARISKEVFKGLLKTGLKINLDFNDDKESDGSVSFNLDAFGIFNSDSDKVKGKKLIILDDVERCQVTMEELFGYINNFVEHSKCNVILIADEEKILEQYEAIEKTEEGKLPKSYKHIKEKLVGQTFVYKSDASRVLQFFINTLDDVGFIEQLDNEAIIDIYNASETENLRSLRQILMSYQRFYSKIPNSYKTYPKTQEYFRQLLYYFFIVGFEYKQGNDQIKEFQDYRNSKAVLGDKGKAYQHILDVNKVTLSQTIFSLPKLYDFFEGNRLTSDDIEQEIKETQFFIEKKQTSVDLKQWLILDEVKFKALFDEEWGKFKNAKVESLSILMNDIDTFLSLLDAGVIVTSKEFIVDKGKKNVDVLVSNLGYSALIKVLAPNGYLEDFTIRTSNGFIGSPEYKMVFSYIKEKLEVAQESEYDTRIKQLLNPLCNDTITQLYDLTDSNTPDGSRMYKDSPMFRSIDGKMMAKSLRKLSNENLRLFNNFLHHIYPKQKLDDAYDLDGYHRENLKCFKDFIKVMSDYKYRVRSVTNSHLKTILKKADTIIAKIEQIPEAR